MMVTRFFPIGRWNKEWNLSQLALLSLPALLIGLILRVMLMVDMPYAGYHRDSSGLLLTPSRLIEKGKFQMDPKKTFLTPTLYTAAFAIPKVPVLVSVPIAQHILGLATVGMVALLCRFWFRHWRWVVVPVTLLVAVNPSLIWFEHVLMAESPYVATTVFLALVGTIYAIRPGRWAFVALCVALVLNAGARPEGKLLFGFGLLLVFLVALPNWRRALPFLGILVALGIVTHFCTRTSQAGLLLYTSLVRISPDESKVAPGIEAYTGAVRKKLIDGWNIRPVFPNSSDRRAVSSAVGSYLKDRNLPHNTAAIEKFCAKLAIETCKVKVFELPHFVYRKLKRTAVYAPADGFGQTWFSMNEAKALRDDVFLQKHSEALLGEKLENQEEINHFFASMRSVEKLGWFNRFFDTWEETAATLRTRDIHYSDGWIEYGVPFYMFAGIGGMLLMMRRAPWQFQVAWGLAMLGLLFTMLLTGNIRARFRLFFEPFWIIYMGVFLDLLLCLVGRSEAAKAEAAGEIPAHGALLPDSGRQD